MDLTTSQIKKEIHDITKQCFSRHKFKTWGDALNWLHTAGHEIVEQEAGSIGQSKLSTEILWLIGIFGPNEKVNWDIVGMKKVPPLTKTKVKISAPKMEQKDTKVKTQLAGKKRVRRKKY